MTSTTAKIMIVVALLFVATATVYVLAQPTPPGGPPGVTPGMAQGQAGGGWPGMAMGMGMMPGWPPAPTPVVVVADGVVYVACDGKLKAFDAKTLDLMGEATYWERPQPPRR